MRRILHSMGAIALLALLGCEPYPTACIDIGDTLEAGTTLYLESCSEDYDFLTWEFSDDRGYIKDVVERQFEDEKDMVLTLTAYSDGAYRSDEIVHSYKTSYRYVDRMEIIGSSTFTSFRLNMAGGQWQEGGATGDFTEAAPYVLYVWPESKAVIPSRKDEGFTVYGIRNGNQSQLASPRYNFETYKENPMVVTSNGLTIKVYWTFRD